MNKGIIMRFISKTFLRLFVLILIFSIAQAQIPNFTCPLYDFNKDILHPEKAKYLHIASCTVYHNKIEINKIEYDRDGRVISDKDGIYSYTYDLDTQKPNYANAYDHAFNDSIRSFYYHNDKGLPSKVSLNYKQSKSQQQIDYAYYDLNLLAVTLHQFYDSKSNQLTSMKTELSYDDNMNKDMARRTWLEYWPGSQESKKYISQELYVFSDSRPQSMIKETKDHQGNQTKEFYRYIYNNEFLLNKIELSKDSTKYKAFETYAYDKKGLPKSRKTPNGTYTYEYSFMQTARLELEIADEIQGAEIYRYFQKDKVKKFLNGPGKYVLDIYLPDMAFLIFVTADGLKYPLMMEPGKTLKIKLENGKFIKMNNDPSNNMIWEIEDYKRRFSAILTVDGLRNYMKEKVDEEFRANPKLPAFLYYTNEYDIRYIDREDDAFSNLASAMTGSTYNYFKHMKEFSQIMLARYPLNPLAQHAYHYRKDDK